jgi:TrmH family RNA methyltransferase
MLLLEGPRFIHDLLQIEEASSLIRFVLCSTELTGNAEEVASHARGIRIPALDVAADLFTVLSSTENSQGIVAVCDVPEPDGELLQKAAFVLALDAVADPGNLGSCIRSAAAFGVDAVVLGRGCACAFAPKVTRASAGTNLLVPLFERVSLPEYASERDRAGCYLVGASSTGGEDLGGLEVRHPLVLFIGSEAHGMSDDVVAQLHQLVRIPMRPEVESLNAAASAAVLLHHFSHLP